MPFIKKLLVLLVLLNMTALKAFADEWDNTSAEDMGISHHTATAPRISGRISCQESRIALIPHPSL